MSDVKLFFTLWGGLIVVAAFIAAIVVAVVSTTRLRRARRLLASKESLAPSTKRGRGRRRAHQDRRRLRGEPPPGRRAARGGGRPDGPAVRPGKTHGDGRHPATTASASRTLPQARRASTSCGVRSTARLRFPFGPWDDRWMRWNVKRPLVRAAGLRHRGMHQYGTATPRA
jgi:hypothetical protein